MFSGLFLTHVLFIFRKVIHVHIFHTSHTIFAKYSDIILSKHGKLGPDSLINFCTAIPSLHFTIHEWDLLHFRQDCLEFLKSILRMVGDGDTKL